MPIPRLVVPKAIWARLEIELQRPERAETVTELSATKQSNPPSGERIIWAPSERLRTLLLDILENNVVFVRFATKKKSSLREDTLNTIARLKSFSP